MLHLPEVGGVTVAGEGAEKWESAEERKICGCSAVFDSDVHAPEIVNGEFILPAHRAQHDYTIHLLETGEALIVKDGRVFLCTTDGDINPILVLTFTPVPADINIARRLLA